MTNEFIKAKSTIAISYSKGVKAIQCYYDGTFDRMGKKLLDHYSKWQTTMKLMNLGTIVVLGDNIKAFDKEKNTGGTLDLTAKGVKKVPCTIYDSIAKLMETETDSEYIYLWITDRWYALKVEDGKPYLSGFDLLTKLV